MPACYPCTGDSRIAGPPIAANAQTTVPGSPVSFAPITYLALKTESEQRDTDRCRAALMESPAIMEPIYFAAAERLRCLLTIFAPFTNKHQAFSNLQAQWFLLHYQ
jgi:hypothetical protein